MIASARREPKIAVILIGWAFLLNLDAADLCAQKIGWYEYGAATPYTFSGTISHETRAGADERVHSIYVLTLDTPINIKRRQEWGDEWRQVQRMQIGFGGKHSYGNSMEDWAYDEKFSAFMLSVDWKHVEVTGSLRGWQSSFQLLPVLIAIDSDNRDSIKILPE